MEDKKRSDKEVYMFDRRNETRMLCADLVQIQWKGKAGRAKRTVANLEDISLSGACLQTEIPIPPEAIVKIEHPNGALVGTVRYCTYRDIGYFVGVEFDADIKWSENKYKPRHLLDPRRLALRMKSPQGNNSPGA
jgi:hypothetical protein